MKEIPFVEKLAWELMQLLLSVTRPASYWHRGKMLIPHGVQLMVTIMDAHFHMIDWMPKEEQQCITNHQNTLTSYLDGLKTEIVPWLFQVLNWTLSNRLNEFGDAAEPEVRRSTCNLWYKFLTS